MSGEGKQFNFKQFSVKNGDAGLKVGTDGVLLGASAEISAEALQAAASSGRCFNVLDIGTGTGLIALMMAQRLTALGAGFTITGIDISPEAAATAAANFAASPWAPSLLSLHCSLAEYEVLSAAGTSDGPQLTLDLIVSNPPYFENSLKNPGILQATARHTDTLSYRHIASFASSHLSPRGTLSLILPSEEETALLRYAASFGLHPRRIISVQTTQRKAPKRIIADFGRDKTQTVRQNLILQDGNCRTAAFNALTEDFYL